MLNRDTLAQLRGLKNQMESEKERTEGVVRGTTSRYGFVRLDDGREVFVPPDEMLKVFPGDRVRVCIRPGKDKRLVADVEALVETGLTRFTGRCVSKGKAMFVEPDLPDLGRWLFIPPKERGAIEEGDYLHCELGRHPIRDGKPQARVLARIGGAQEAGIENTYTLARHDISTEWSEEQLAQLDELLATRDPLQDSNGREDFTDLAFVSIDAARTQDIDDALYAEVTSDGWVLYVAIADPTAYIDSDSPLLDVVRSRASSIYFHGTVVPMLPEVLAQQRCALIENELRPALVCRLNIAEDGSLGEFRFFEGKIRSRAKLSYYAVDRYLSGQDESLICHATPLEALYQVSRALRARREAHELVMDDRQEYRWLLDEKGHIDSIEASEKLASQRLVEECMVATNRCAAQLLSTAGAAGPFVIHDGFRKDKRQDRDAFLKAYVDGADDLDVDSLAGYRELVTRLATSEHELPLRAMLNRLLTRARLSRKPGAHMGMSLPQYTNCTSPLRKYLDFLAQLQIKAVLRGADVSGLAQSELEGLNQRLLQLRKVSQEAERWLIAEYLARQAGEMPGPWDATVSYIGNDGISVRLDANGLEGFVALPMANRKNRQGPKTGKKGKKSGQKKQELFSFDKLTATLHSSARAFRVEQPVRVSFAGVADEPRHQTLFTLAPESGLREDKHESPASGTTDTGTETETGTGTGTEPGTETGTESGPDDAGAAEPKAEPIQNDAGTAEPGTEPGPEDAGAAG